MPFWVMVTFEPILYGFCTGNRALARDHEKQDRRSYWWSLGTLIGLWNTFLQVEAGRSKSAASNRNVSGRRKDKRKRGIVIGESQYGAYRASHLGSASELNTAKVGTVRC